MCSPSRCPGDYRAGGWSAAWVGFDAVLFLAFAATAWAAWRRRQMLILCLVVLATLLCCDAWFDITLDWGTPGFMDSLALALVVELPLAVLAMIGARRLLRLTFGRLARAERRPRAGAAVLEGAAVRRLFGRARLPRPVPPAALGPERGRPHPAPRRVAPGRTRDARRATARPRAGCRRRTRYDGTGWAGQLGRQRRGRSGNRNR